jgi:ADP-heptose:LPS heptosyltransferase
MWASSRERGLRVLVNVSAGTPARRWPDERYVEVLRHVHAARPDAQLRVLGSPADRSRTAHIAHDGAATPTNTPRLRDAIALVATADLVITPDTSIAHAASAFGTPAVALYRRGTADAWGLYGTEGVNVLADGDLDALPVERVLPAVDRMLRAIAGAPGESRVQPTVATAEQPTPRPVAPLAQETGATAR